MEQALVPSKMAPANTRGEADGSAAAKDHFIWHPMNIEAPWIFKSRVSAMWFLSCPKDGRKLPTFLYGRERDGVHRKAVELQRSVGLIKA